MRRGRRQEAPEGQAASIGAAVQQQQNGNADSPLPLPPVNPSPAPAPHQRPTRRRPGRPGVYDEHCPERVFRLALLGLTDEELGIAFGIDENTLDLWRHKYPDFNSGLTRGREDANSYVAQALFHRAIGYSHHAVDIKIADGVIIQTPIIKHYPPDTSAAIFWLKCRQKKYWFDLFKHEHGGSKDTPPIQIEDVTRQDLSDFTDQELELIERLHGQLEAKRARNGNGSSTTNGKGRQRASNSNTSDL